MQDHGLEAEETYEDVELEDRALIPGIVIEDLIT
jgi:hypothetical protein